MKFLSLFFLILLLGCTVDDQNDNELEHAAATLYYQPDCATINGYINLKLSDEKYVFQHEIEEEFRAMGVEIKVAFRKHSKSDILTNECITAPIITIASLEKQ